MGVLPLPILEALQDDQGWNTSSHYRFLSSLEKNLRSNIADTENLQTSVTTLQTQRLTGPLAKTFDWNGSSSNTAIEFTGIPSWVQSISVMFNSVQKSATNVLLIKLGTALNGYESSNYLGSSTVLGTGVVTAAMSDGFSITPNSTYSAALYTYFGIATINILNPYTNTWAFSSNISAPSIPYTFVSSGSKSLTGALDRIAITSSGGSDVFNAGIINILYA